MPLHIALTGATGFVGRAVVEKLLASGHSVTALVRDVTAAKLPPSVHMIVGDLHNDAALQKLTAKQDVVLHVAGAILGVGRQDFIRANVEGTRNVAAAARANGVKRVVFISSLAAREPGIGPYGESKLLAEQLLQSYAQHFSLKILRPAAVYGPGDKATLPLLKTLLAQVAVIPGVRRAKFSMIHVDDVALEVVRAAEADDTGLAELDDGEAGHTWPELIAIVRENFGTAQSVVFIPRPAATALGLCGDALARVLRKPVLISSRQMRQLYHPNWVADAASNARRIRLRDGLPSTIGWYQAQGLLPQRNAPVRSANNCTDTR
jgi:nucleoside-diphosphate-sugar epimerase